MDVLIGTIALLVVLALFSLFTFKAPYGSKAMSALAAAAVASFLIEALIGSVLGDMLGIAAFQEIGDLAGSLSGIAAGALVAMALNVQPGYALMISLPLANMGILPGFIAGYLVSFLVRWFQERIPNGINLLAIIFIATPLTYFIAALIAPSVDGILLNIGSILESAQSQSSILMGIILGGVLTVTSTAPLSSMALTAIMGLTGQPMAIAAMAIFGSGFLNYTFFRRMGLTTPQETISVAIEALTKAHVISANPIPVYVTNFIYGGIAGIIIALSGLVNNSPGTAAVVPGLASTFAWNPPIQVILVGVIVAVIGVTVGLICSFIFKNYPIKTEEELLTSDDEELEEKDEAITKKSNLEAESVNA
ncbi:PTS sugar transporter subunit IIC [Oceanobacillus salinisoli]|uniref:PTS sugar transporter subunit IIC n=1 Tax=Oceanobacillus salinisoli TaxID=2678611 RepID=UPI0012E26801|nr:PTS sugar transporter subunit IIC [Oceanobacillus salinisoli]